MKTSNAIPTSATSKLIDYFERNQDEELTYADASIKLDVPTRRLMGAIKEPRAVANGIEVVTVIRRRRELGAKP